MEKMENSNIVKIKNFNLGIFRSLLDQNLTVNKNIMIEFSKDMVKSSAMSPSRSFMKLWMIPMSNLIGGSEQEEGKALDIDNLEEENVVAKLPKELEDMPTFNFYLMKGDLFRKYISVHNSELVNLEFTLTSASNNGLQASTLTIYGKSELGSPLVTIFTLTTEEMIVDRIESYEPIINEVTPSENMMEVVLSSVQLQEIKRLIKQLHKSSTENTAYITLIVNKTNLIIKDKVFEINIPLNENLISNIDEETSFNILKTDFLMLGNHTFTIYTSPDSQKVIFITKFGESMISGLSTKVSENNDFGNNDNEVEGIIDFDDIDEYLG